MRRQFKGKKKYNLKVFYWIFLFFITIFINLYVMDKISFSNIYTGKGKIIDLKIDKEDLLLRFGLNYKKSKEDVTVFNEIELPEIKKKIYIYNTHQTEEYKDYNVLKAAKYLANVLKKKRFYVYVEETNIQSVVNKNNWKYKDSYKVTRELLNKKINEEYDLYIDFHRDSSNKKTTTTNINDKDYARLMFVIGSKHDTYDNNYQLVESLNMYLKNFNKSISRGIYVRKSSSYNQDLDPNVILIEVGGVENNEKEVNNSLDILADVLENYFYE